MLFKFFFIPLQAGVLTRAGAGSKYLTAAEIDTASHASMQSSAGSGALERAGAGSMCSTMDADKSDTTGAASMYSTADAGGPDTGPRALPRSTRQALHLCPSTAGAATPDRAGVDTTYFTTGAAEIGSGGSCAGAWSCELCEGRCGAFHNGQSAGSTG